MGSVCSTSSSSETVHVDAVGLRRASIAPERLVMITDAGADLDDEMAIIMLRHLVDLGLVEPLAAIANLHPSFDRARLVRGTFDMLGMWSTQIGIGTDGGPGGVGYKDTFSDTASGYMSPTFSERTFQLQPGRQVLHAILAAAAPKSISLLLISSLKDVALFLRDNQELFVRKVKEVSVMGGVKPFETASEGQLLEPDSAHNNEFDAEAAAFFYRRCQELGVRLVIVTRVAAYSCPVGRHIYDDLARLGSPVAWRLRKVQRESIESLWKRACAPVGSRERRGLPERCSKQWFSTTFCGGKVAERTAEESIWDAVVSFNMYDPIALLATVPRLRERFFDPRTHNVNGVDHLVIGNSTTEPGIRDPPQLLEFMERGFISGLCKDTKVRTNVLMCAELRWDNATDESVFLIVLRVLYEIGVVNCLGIILIPGPTEMMSHRRGAGSADARSDARGASETEQLREMLEEHAVGVRETLRALGLEHITVDTGLEPARTLERVYRERAPPTGLVLLNAGCLTSLARFISADPELFFRHTLCVVILGGVKDSTRAWGDEVKDGGADDAEAGYILPDDTAQNIALDRESANVVYRSCQRLSVPLTVVTRHLANACYVPRALYDLLAASGSPVGRTLREQLKDSICQLWRKAASAPDDPARCRLPARCDARWFADVFCEGRVPPVTEEGLAAVSRGQDAMMDSENEAAAYDEAVWQATRRIPVYNAHLLFAAVPQTRNAFFQAEWRPVRGISHMVIGASAEKTGLRHEDSEESQRRLVHFLCQMIARGVRMNHSLFEPAKETATELGKPRRKDLTIDLDFQAASAVCGSLQLDLSDEPFPKWMINEDPELFSPYSALSGVVAPSHAILRENEDILRTPRMFADDGIPKESQTPNSKQRGSRDTPSTEPLSRTRSLPA